MTHVKFYKNPLSILDYSMDWSDFLTDADAITASEWMASSPDITIASGAFTTSTTTIWVSDGVTDITYDIVNHITTQLGREDYRTLSIFILDEPNELEELIPALRMHLGDTVQTSYRYLDEWLIIALESAIKALQRWWGDKYLIDLTGNFVVRNPNSLFIEESPPEIEDRDQRPIILMAAILIKSGQLENNSWAVGSWKDAEIAVSNIEGSRGKQFGLNLDWQELQMYLKMPSKRLFGGTRTDLPNEDRWYN